MRCAYQRHLVCHALNLELLARNVKDKHAILMLSYSAIALKQTPRYWGWGTSDAQFGFVGSSSRKQARSRRLEGCLLCRWYL